MTTDVYNVNVEVQEDESGEFMPTFEHGIIEANISAELRAFVKGKNIGRVSCSSAEYRFTTKAEGEASKKSGRQPDISFVRQEKLPARFRSYPNVAPDLAIEIVSPSDKPYETEARIQEYQLIGVQLIWIVNPFSRTVDVYRQKDGVKLQRFVEGEELQGENVIPGFKLAVSDIFDYPTDPDPVPDPKTQHNR